MVTLSWSVKFGSIQRWTQNLPKEIWPTVNIYTAAILVDSVGGQHDHTAGAVVYKDGVMLFTSGSKVTAAWHEGSATYPIG